ncbi:MAG: hypothetical protein E6Q90_03975, partial [Actinobacteria bacterium]
MAVNGSGMTGSRHWHRWAAFAALVGVAALLLALLGAPLASASGTPQLDIAVAPLHSERVAVKAGEPAAYSWDVTCAGPANCPDAALEVEVPAPLTLVDPIVQTDGRQISWDEQKRTYKIAFTQPYHEAVPAGPAEPAVGSAGSAAEPAASSDASGSAAAAVEPQTVNRQGLTAGAVQRVDLALALPESAAAGLIDGQEWQLRLRAITGDVEPVKADAWLVAVVPPPPPPSPVAVAPSPSDVPPAPGPSAVGPSGSAPAATADSPSPSAAGDPSPSAAASDASPAAAEPSVTASAGTSPSAPSPVAPLSPQSATPKPQADPVYGQIDKSANRQSIKPGEEVSYTIVATCSSLTTPCLDFTITDVLPAQFEVTSLPQSNSQRIVSFDPGTRTLTIQYQIPVTGGTGLPAGSTQSLQVAMRLPSQTPVVNGTLIPNTASVNSVGMVCDDVHICIDSMNVLAEIPVNPQPVGTKTWAPGSAVAQSGATSVISLGARNASSSSTSVRQLAISDSSRDTFDNFDIAGVGPVTAFPPGANRVIVDLCFKPAGSPCAEGEWVSSGQQAGPALVPPAGTLSDATGIRYRFVDAGGADIPFSANGGQVDTTVKLRNTNRSTSQPISPPSRLSVNNCATPALTNQASAWTSGTQACAPFSILPDAITVDASKTIYADNAGSYTANGKIVVGQNSGVSMNLTARNASAQAVGNLSIKEPSATAANEFAKLDVTQARIIWPDGVTAATLRVTCRSGADPGPVTVTKTSSPQDIASLGCASGVFPAGVQIDFTSPGGGTPPTIPAGASGSLLLHGTAARVTTDDAKDGLTNCADMSASIPGGASSSVAQACATAVVADPKPTIGSRSKTSYGVFAIIPNQPMDFGISYKNTGNIPMSNVVTVDPVDPTAPGNPFDLVSLAEITTSKSVPATIEVWDPTAGSGGAYVAYDKSNAALLARAKGLRVAQTGNLDPGSTFNIYYTVMLRDSAPDGATFRNCAAMGVGTPNAADPVCNRDDVTVVRTPSANASLTKVIDPTTITRPGPGIAPQTLQVRHGLVNTGTYNLSALAVTDTDADFFDAVTFLGNIHVNYPEGATRAQIDVCLSAADCTGGTFVNGVKQSGSGPLGLPVGVTPDQVKGVRVTFSDRNGDFVIVPSDRQKTSPSCPNANVCFDVRPNQYLASSPATPIPDKLADTSNGTGTSQQGGLVIPPVTADVDVLAGQGTIGFTKGPDSRIGPGETAPFSLVTENTGSANLNDVTIVDPLPSQLDFDPVIAGAPAGQPYVITYSLPTGFAPPATVDFVTIKGDPANPPTPGCTDPNRVCKLSWSFPGYQLPPGGKVEIQFNVKLAPGVLSDVNVVNTAGASGNGGTAQCTTPGSASGPPFGSGTFCTDSASITTVAGDDFQAQKWIKADPALGFLNAAGQTVPVTDPQCPQYASGGAVYTRFPCVARVLPGQQIDYLIRGINSGTNPAKQIVLVDGLPVQGDNGVLLSSQARGTEWNNRPVMSSPVVNLDGYPGVVTGYTDAAYTGPGFCRASIQLPPNDQCPPGSFSAAFGPANTGFQTVMTFPDGQLLNPGQSFTLAWSMTAPDTLASASAEPVAWNSFAYRPTFQHGAVQNTLPPAEPLKVGVAMPLAHFTVAKAVVDLPAGATVPPYEFAYSCTSGTAPVASGTFTLVGGASWTSSTVPSGSVCRVWETNAQGATSSNLGEANAATVTVDATNPTVTITNSYDTGSITVAKSVTWDGAPPFPVGAAQFNVSCAFPDSGNVLLGYPQQFYLDDGSSTTLSGLPVGAACTVTETDTRGASTTVIKPSNANAVTGVTATVAVEPDKSGGTRVDVGNRFTTGALQLTKKLSGDATAWAQGPFVLDVHCTHDAMPDLDYRVTLFANQLSTTISSIPTGYLCQVTEAGIGGASASSITPSSVTIPPYVGPPPGPVVVTIDNTFEPGYVKLTKSVDGSAAAHMAGAVYHVRLQCERDIINGGGTQVFLDRDVALGGAKPADYTVSIPDPLPMGARCWTEETDSVGATTVTNPQDVNHKVTIDRAGTFDFSVTNTYDGGGNTDGSIQVNKTVTGSAAAFATPFSFLAKCTVGGFAIPDATVTIDPKGPLTGYFTGLPVGAVCDVSETDNGGAAGTVPVALGSVTVPAKGSAPVVVNSVNDFPGGSVALAKAVNGAAAGVMAGAEFTVHVTCTFTPQVGSPQTVVDEDLKIKDGQTLQVKAVLPVGTSCWAAETDSVGATSVAIDHDLAHPIAITAQSLTPTINVANTYDPGGTGGGSVTGGIKVTKTLTGSAAQYAQGPFEFTATCTLGGFNLPVQNLTLTPTQLVGYFQGLPVGASCAMAETKSGSATGPVPVDLGTVVIPAYTASPVAVSASNDFPSADLTIAKTVVGPGSGPFAFTLECTISWNVATYSPPGLKSGSNGPVVPRTPFTLGAGESKVFPVPWGAECTIIETDSRGAAISFSQGGFPGGAKVTMTGSQGVTVTNTFPPTPTPTPTPTPIPPAPTPTPPALTLPATTPP